MVIERDDRAYQKRHAPTPFTQLVRRERLLEREHNQQCEQLPPTSVTYWNEP